jgi:acetolactate synthase-1/3 small subunit
MPVQSHEVRRHTFAVLVENKFGVLGRITGLFSARGFNIEPLRRRDGSDCRGYSRHEGIPDPEQVLKQLNKLIDVLRLPTSAKNRTWTERWCLLR